MVNINKKVLTTVEHYYLFLTSFICNYKGENNTICQNYVSNQFIKVLGQYYFLAKLMCSSQS